MVKRNPIAFGVGTERSDMGLGREKLQPREGKKNQPPLPVTRPKRGVGYRHALWCSPPRRGGGGFMATIRVQILEVFPTHEPTFKNARIMRLETGEPYCICERVFGANVVRFESLWLHIF